MNYQNFENKTIKKLPSEIEGSNFTNVKFGDTSNTFFIKCNLDKCEFTKPASFDRSNICDTELPEGSVLIKSNHYKSEDMEFPIEK